MGVEYSNVSPRLGPVPVKLVPGYISAAGVFRKKRKVRQPTSVGSDPIVAINTNNSKVSIISFDKSPFVHIQNKEK
jgi:hypothetical protein